MNTGALNQHHWGENTASLFSKDNYDEGALDQSAVFTAALLELLTAQLQKPVGPGRSHVCTLLLNLSLALQTLGLEKKRVRVCDLWEERRRHEWG